MARIRQSTRSRCNGISVFEPLETRSLMSAGGVDVSTAFNFHFPGGGHDTVVQPDGKTIVVGTSGGRMAIARLNPDFTPDTTFGPNHDGQAFAALGGPLFVSEADAVAIDGSGKIIVAGTATEVAEGESYVALVRYLPNGAIDPTFGDSAQDRGFTLCDLDGEQRSTVADMAIQPDGRIVVAGQGWNTHFFGNDTQDMLVGRFNSNGTIDEVFGDGGHRFIGGSGGAVANAIAVEKNSGNIVVVGTTISTVSDEVMVGRLNYQGNIDSSFNNGQAAFVSVNGRPTQAGGVTLASDGKIVIAGNVQLTPGNANHTVALMRLLSNGQLDNTFGQLRAYTKTHVGWTTVSIGSDSQATDVIQNGVGDLLLCGKSSNNGGEGVIVKYTANGNRDASFGNLGIVETKFADHAGYTRLATGPGLRFIAVGGSKSFDVTRYFDARANQVKLNIGNVSAAEFGTVTASFEVLSSEALPWPRDVYFTVSGSASAPTVASQRFKTADYSLDGMHMVVLSSTRAFVEIPANSFGTFVTVLPIDDRNTEANETAIFQMNADPSYQITGSPNVVITIADDRMNIRPLLTGTATTQAVASVAAAVFESNTATNATSIFSQKTIA
jgi:uncharacterized delta-60 repeat protein